MSLLSIAPELLVCFTILLVIGLDLLLTQDQKAGRMAFVLGLGLTLALSVLLGLYFGGFLGSDNFHHAFMPDAMSVFFRATLLLSALLTILLSVNYVSKKIPYSGEFYALLGLATLGAMFMVSATEILTLYLALELLSISSFVLVALRKDSPRSSEAAIKYLIFGGISSGILLFGFSLLFGITGSLHFSEINTFLQQMGGDFVYRPDEALKIDYGQQNLHLKIELLASILMIVAGLAYKIAAAPFHMWAPDVYEGAPLPVTAFLSSSSKVAGFAALIRVLEALSADVTVPIWAKLVIILSVVSMTYGNVVAIAQHNVKRIFAYSSIAHAGYLLMGVLALSEFKSRDTALLGLFYYLLVYVFMNLGAFAVITYFAGQAKSSRLQDWSGLGQRHPWLGFVLAACLLSLTGLPPFAGFTGKFYLFSSVLMMGNQYIWLALIAVLNSVVSLYYYARIIRVVFFGNADLPKESAESPDPALVFASIISLAGIVILFLFPSWLIHLVSQIHSLI